MISQSSSGHQAKRNKRADEKGHSQYRRVGKGESKDVGTIRNTLAFARLTDSVAL